MDIMEIVLLIAGGIIFILSFFIPERKRAAAGGTDAQAEERIQELVNQELEAVKSHVDEVVEEAVSYSMEKTERSLERLSNEKIMAVSEYSDTVLAEIHKNHEETVFLYDMLNNKHTSLKNTLAEVNRTVKAAEDAMASFQKLISEKRMFEDKSVEEPVSEGQTEPSTETRPDAARQELPEEGKLSSEAETKADNNNENIRRLYKQGKSAVVIARELGLGVGEVKLVIDLFQSQQNRGNK